MRQYSDFLAELFPDTKVQKISVEIGASCPNRDGTLGTGGCIYCSNATFTPEYCSPLLSVTEQIERGKRFFARKYREMKYLAYFQSYTCTRSLELPALLEEALRCEDVVGIVIGTRPDSIPEPLLAKLAEINRTSPVLIELGAESSHNRTLERINRGHTWEQTVEAVRRCADAGLKVGLHLIMGLPGETEQMMLETVERVCALPISSIKFHQLQVVKNTRLQKMYEQNPECVKLFSPENYLYLCAKIVKMVPESIAIDRFVAQSPPDLLVAPAWGIKNYQFTDMLKNYLK